MKAGEPGYGIGDSALNLSSIDSNANDVDDDEQRCEELELSLPVGLALD